MMRFENQIFDYFEDRDTGRLFSGIEFTNCTFIGGGFSSISLSDDETFGSVNLRSTAKNMTFRNCRVDGVGFIGPGIIEDCLIDGLKVSKHLQTTGTAFKHVLITGDVDKLMITPYIDFLNRFPATQRSLDDANQEYYSSMDWALDISEARFKDCDIRAVPAHLIRRDPETQVVITREKVIEGQWRNLDLSETYWPTAIEFFLKDGCQDGVLVAPKRARKFEKLLDGLKKLRDAGVVEPD